ncbi:MAG: carboxymuconolactone decarboxylase family protein [Pirellulales bacterium]
MPDTVPDIDAVLNEIKEHFALLRAPALFASIAAHEGYFRTTWQKYQTVMLTGEIEAPTKQLMGLAVAVTKTNDYMIGLQKREVRQSGLSDREQLEALAVADFFEGFDSFAHALHVDSELRPRKLAAGDMSLIDREIDVNVPYVLDSDDAAVREVYEEIKKSMCIPFVPNIFKALAHQPAMLQAKWESYKAIMGTGKLKRLTKELVAVTVSAVNACFY